MNAICLAIDRLHIGQVGAYGNAWIETPSLDALACESFVFDQALVSSPRIESLYGSIWQGRHPLLGRGNKGVGSLCSPPTVGSRETSAEQRLPTPLFEGTTVIDWPRWLGQSGIATTLLTDEPSVADDPMAQGFGEMVELDMPSCDGLADEVGATHLARCFAQLIDWLGSAEGPFLLWVHLSSLGTCWDAPYAMRQQYVESGDPEPPRSAVVPQRMLPEDFDPDALLGIVQSYAAQVSLLDTCIGALAEAIDERSLADDTLLALFSARGFPLGEHRRVGACDDALDGELAHVPMMIRFPGGLGAAGRSQALVTPADLRPTLSQWWSLEEPVGATIGKSLLPIVRGEVEMTRDRLLLGSRGAETAIRTPAWYMRLLDEPRLYVKPDDRWEVNDVADRCPEVVDALRAAADEFRGCLDAGRPDDAAPLGEVLRTGLG